MKRIVMCILCLTMFFSNFSLYSFAKDTTYETLKAQQKAYWQKYYQIDTVDNCFHWSLPFEDGPEYFPPLANCFLLFYTEQAKDWTLTENINQYDLAPVEHFSEVLKAFQDSFRLDENSGFLIFLKPKLLCAIEKLGIPKEELYAARNRMISNPDSGCFPTEQVKKDIIQALNSEDASQYYYVEDFMIEALYLPDNRDAIDLSLSPYAVYTPQGIVTPQTFRLLHSGKNGDTSNFSRILQYNVREEDFERMDSYVRAYCAQYDHASNEERKEKEADYLRMLMDKAKTLYYPAPQAGEHTVFYALAAVSALSALAALCVQRKKKRIG